MSKILVDVVLLPSDEITELAIMMNRELLKGDDRRIILDRTHALPHISLAMGAIDERDIPEIEKILEVIVGEFYEQELFISGVRVGRIRSGKPWSSFTIQNTPVLQALHERVMRALCGHLTYDLTMEMIYTPPKAEALTLHWVNNYPLHSAFANYEPHISLGFGTLKTDMKFPISFVASKLAVFHIGSFCTCRKKLLELKLNNEE